MFAPHVSSLTPHLSQFTHHLSHHSLSLSFPPISLIPPPPPSLPPLPLQDDQLNEILTEVKALKAVVQAQGQRIDMLERQLARIEDGDV